MGSGFRYRCTLNGVVSQDVTELVQSELVFADVLKLLRVAVRVGLLHFAQACNHFLYLNEHVGSDGVNIVLMQVQNL